ncbi:hypothetical protein D3C86_1954650 [compost metagenome]
MNAQQKIDKILNTVKEGKTVYITTALRSYKITQKTLSSWEKSGLELFKVQGDSMMMASGKQYLCIDYCKFTVEG